MSVDEPTECRICHNQRASDACGPRCGAQACSCWGSSWSSLGTREGPSWPCRWERLTRRSLGMKLPWLRPIVNKVRVKQKQNEMKKKQKNTGNHLGRLGRWCAHRGRALWLLCSTRLVAQRTVRRGLIGTSRLLHVRFVLICCFSRR